MKHLAILGTSSNVGKTILVAGICRTLSREGIRVAPFKAQNMALNAYAVRSGGEIGYAQALQAWAAGIEPTVDMNPILIKPQANHRTQWIIQGKPQDPPPHGGALADRSQLFGYATESFDRLAAQFDVIVIEGAGSPVELNLMAGDLANFRIARYADASVLLVADIDRGGVFAALYGTLALLSAADRRRVAGVLVNKFRGDPRLFDHGREILEHTTKKPVLGVIPYREFALPEEDGAALESKPKHWRNGAGVKILVVRVPHLSNFTDLLPLEREPGISLAWKTTPGLERPDVVFIPGSKATISDLLWLRAQGWGHVIQEWERQGTVVFGICGGFQMLGHSVCDPWAVEGDVLEAQGLGLIPAVTVIGKTKETHQANGWVQAGQWPRVRVSGYEIHAGETRLAPGTTPFLMLADGPDGYISTSGRVIGTYLHGIFDRQEFRQAFLLRLGMTAAVESDPVDAGLDLLEEVIRESVGVGVLRRLIES